MTTRELLRRFWAVGLLCLALGVGLGCRTTEEDNANATNANVTNANVANENAANANVANANVANDNTANANE